MHCCEFVKMRRPGDVKDMPDANCKQASLAVTAQLNRQRVNRDLLRESSGYPNGNYEAAPAPDAAANLQSSVPRIPNIDDDKILTSHASIASGPEVFRQ